MAHYTNISSIATTTLITKGGNVKGGISRISIVNHDNTDAVIVKLYLDDGGGSDANNPYTLAETTIPPLVTLVLEDNLSFDSSIFNLKIDTSTTAEITVIIK
tara:strand:+ start:982 stop:1287 length:306 start_codon:yes stop_codon:yes gene_type:complete